MTITAQPITIHVSSYSLLFNKKNESRRSTTKGRNDIVDLFTASSEAPDNSLDRADESFYVILNKKVIVVDGSTDSMLERSTQLISKFVSLGTLGLWEEYSVQNWIVFYLGQDVTSRLSSLCTMCLVESPTPLTRQRIFYGSTNKHRKGSCTNTQG